MGDSVIQPPVVPDLSLPDFSVSAPDDDDCFTGCHRDGSVVISRVVFRVSVAAGVTLTIDPPPLNVPVRIVDEVFGEDVIQGEVTLVLPSNASGSLRAMIEFVSPDFNLVDGVWENEVRVEVNPEPGIPERDRSNNSLTVHYICREG